MSKYDPLWNYLLNISQEDVLLTFEEIHDILGFEIDHSFLRYKKEAPAFGYEIKKISIKNKAVLFNKPKSSI